MARRSPAAVAGLVVVSGFLHAVALASLSAGAHRAHALAPVERPVVVRLIAAPPSPLADVHDPLQPKPATTSVQAHEAQRMHAARAAMGRVHAGGTSGRDAAATITAVADIGQRRVRHFATDELDRPPLPRSAPDPSLTADVPRSGLPMRLRLFIDANGSVSDVAILQASDLDAEAVEAIKKMFSETAFVAGRRDGIDVPSFFDVEVRLD